MLLLSCPDRPGIVAAVAGFVTDIGGNIVEAEQHTDPQDGVFFQRVEFTLDAVHLDDAGLLDAFNAVADRFSMNVQLRFTDWRPRTAVLVSKPPHCLADVLARSFTGELDLDIRLVVSNHIDNAALADAFKVPYHHLPVVDGDRVAQEAAVDQLLHVHDVELVVLARYMLILSPWFVERWAGRVLNIHHSFLPAFVGASPYRQAHDRGVKVIGATAHYVTTGLDEGPIIEQDVTRVSHRDGVATMARRGR